jgi:hypothetical protein
MRAVLPLILLLGCSPPSGVLSPTPTPLDTPTPTSEPTRTEEDVPGGEPGDDGASMFAADRFVQIDIELPEASWDALIAAPYEYTPAHVTIDGRRMEDIGVRLRGRIGSFRDVWLKPKWRLDFNRYTSGRRVDGLEALSLDNNVADCSGLKQMLAWHVAGLADTHASRGGFAQVTVGGVEYGIYSTVEVQDDRYLVRRFEDGSGNLYDGAYLWFGEWNYTLLDFTAGIANQYELEEGVDIGAADTMAISDALGEAVANDDFVGTLDAVFDMETFFRYAAVEHWIGQNDGYILNTNNYRVYFDPLDGRATLISYDLDNTFMAQPWGHSWDNPRGVIAWHCMREPDCYEGIRSAVSDLLDLLDAVELEASFDGWDTLTQLPAINDPKSGCSPSQIGNQRTYLRDWIRGRDGALRNYWGL